MIYLFTTDNTTIMKKLEWGVSECFFPPCTVFYWLLLGHLGPLHVSFIHNTRAKTNIRTHRRSVSIFTIWIMKMS